MNLSVIVPAYNEANVVGETLKRLIKQPDVHQIIVVDDGSTDNTVKDIEAIKDKRILLIKQAYNMGKGAAIHTGLRRVTGDFVLIQDADMEYDPSDIPQLIKPIIEHKAEVVYGSRFLGSRSNMFFWHFLGNKFLNLLVNILYNSILTDLETGYKVMPTRLMQSLNLSEKDFRFEVELTSKLLKKKIKIYEVPISYSGRTYDEGKKITWVDGLRAVSSIFRTKFSGDEFVIPSLEPLFQILRIKAVEPFSQSGLLIDIGCDEPPMVINRWKKRMKKCIGLDLIAVPRKYENVEIMNMEISTEIKLQSGIADTITMLAVLEHMKFPQDIIRECARLLKKDGVLLVTVPSPKAKRILEILARIGLVRKEMIDQHENYFKQEQLRLMCKQAHLKIECIWLFEFGLNTLLVARKE